MTVELHAGERRQDWTRDGGTQAGTELVRPRLSGDLPTVLEPAPMFRRALAGYDRFQVDTYAQWAETELATAERERARLLARYLSTQAALDEAQALLSHSSSGGQFVQVSERIGAMLAAATDDAEAIRAEAEAARALSEARAADMVAAAQRSLAEATETAARVLADGDAQARRAVSEAGVSAERIVDEARRAAADLHAEAAARLEQARADELRAADRIEQLRRQAEQENAAARAQARADVVRMLAVGRDERQRADAEAAESRQRAEQDALARRAALLAEVDALDARRAALQAELGQLTEAAAARTAPHQRPERRGRRFPRWATPAVRSSLR